MKRLNQRGSNTVLLAAISLLVLLFIGALSFGIWAFGSRQDYKNNVDGKITAAVKVAEDRTATAKDNQFAEQEKQPLKSYKGPDTYGRVTIKYPKAWSGYVSQSGDSGNPLDGYFYPGVVPGLQSNTPYALRIEVTTDSYAEELKQFSDDVTGGKARVTAYRAAKVSGTLGSRIDGALTSQIQGSMVIFPLRDKALKIWTESPQFVNDFNKNILPNLSFVP